MSHPAGCPLQCDLPGLHQHRGRRRRRSSPIHGATGDSPLTVPERAQLFLLPVQRFS
jgi:hypothetical protein